MSDFKQNIDGHNKTKLSHQVKLNCPTKKSAIAKNQVNAPCHKFVYQNLLSIPNHSKNIWQAPHSNICWTDKDEFKTRYTNHKTSFNNYEKRHSTELCKYIWNLKNNNISFSIRWKILKRAKSYCNASKRCNLCIWEKYFIICKPNVATCT
jgi:hypothetical protein